MYIEYESYTLHITVIYKHAVTPVRILYTVTTLSSQHLMQCLVVSCSESILQCRYSQNHMQKSTDMHSTFGNKIMHFYLAPSHEQNSQSQMKKKIE